MLNLLSPDTYMSIQILQDLVTCKAKGFISAHQLSLLLFFHVRAAKCGLSSVTASYSFLNQETGISGSSLQRDIKKLRGLGILDVSDSESRPDPTASPIKQYTVRWSRLSELLAGQLAIKQTDTQSIFDNHIRQRNVRIPSTFAKTVAWINESEVVLEMLTGRELHFPRDIHEIMRDAIEIHSGLKLAEHELTTICDPLSGMSSIAELEWLLSQLARRRAKNAKGGYYTFLFRNWTNTVPPEKRRLPPKRNRKSEPDQKRSAFAYHRAAVKMPSEFIGGQIAKLAKAGRYAEGYKMTIQYTRTKWMEEKLDHLLSGSGQI